MSRSGIVSAGFCVFVGLSPGEAQAYLDPATGSLIIQTLVGGLAAAALIVKTYWRQIKAWFGYAPQDPDSASGATRVAEDRRGDD